MRHTAEDWFNKELTQLNTGVEYFETKFKRNTIGGIFKVPASTAKRYTMDSINGRNVIFMSLAQKYIDALVKIKPKLRQIPFKALLTEDKFALLEFICECIQYSVLNQQVWQKVSGSNISTPSFTINVDTTPWALTADMCGMAAWNILMSIGIDYYEWVDERKLWSLTKNGNAMIITKTSDLDLIAELTLGGLYE